MSSNPSAPGESDVDLPQEVLELVAALPTLPLEWRTRLTPIVERVVASTSRRRRILNLVQDALGQLRLDMKYLVFDLESTRRERDEYRRKLESP